jgi:hypothetical protein
VRLFAWAVAHGQIAVSPVKAPRRRVTGQRVPFIFDYQSPEFTTGNTSMMLSPKTGLGMLLTQRSASSKEPASMMRIAAAMLRDPLKIHW